MKNLLLAIMAAAVMMFSGCSSKEATPGYAGPAEVSTYFIAPLMSTDEVKSKLESAGFEIVAVDKVGKKKLDSIVFTNDHLKALADKPGRGFLAGALRVLVNTEGNEVRISNPRYFVKAFLQDDYKLGDEQPLLDAINKAFGELKPSEDKWEFAGLADYQFMMGRPYYQDVIVAGEGETAALNAKIEGAKKKDLVFKLDVGEGRTLYGVKLNKRTMKFVDKIGVQNAAILPWMVLVEDNKATAMRADYLIAISYPLLDMGGFMGIMTVPGAVEKDVSKYFK
ncbi:hypothetical protein [Sulfurimonas sp. HSL3-7]|uniref:hypothetical protein n=1 Tax=Sulfonitrofixus jiaomeiensis TaxID=3131938 RepID=UPI0031F9A571